MKLRLIIAAMSMAYSQSSSYGDTLGSPLLRLSNIDHADIPVSCSTFAPNDDGTWSNVMPFSFVVPDDPPPTNLGLTMKKGTYNIDGHLVIRPGTLINGVDLIAQFESQCRKK